MGSHERSWDDLAAPVGQMIARKGFHLLTGAGGGVMTAVAGAFAAEKDRKGLSIGIIPTTDRGGVFHRSEEHSNPFIEIPIVTPLDVRAQGSAMPYSRNHVNIMTSDVVIVLPGDVGTRHEVALSIQFAKPHLLFGPREAFALFPEDSERTQSILDVERFIDTHAQI